MAQTITCLAQEPVVSAPSTPSEALPHELLAASVTSILLASPRSDYAPIHPALSLAWNLRLSPRQPPSPRDSSTAHTSSVPHRASPAPPFQSGSPSASGCDAQVVKQSAHRTLSPSRERRKWSSLDACDAAQLTQAALAGPSAGDASTAEMDRLRGSRSGSCVAVHDALRDSAALLHASASSPDMAAQPSPHFRAAFASPHSLTPLPSPLPSPRAALPFASVPQNRTLGRPPRPPRERRGRPLSLLAAAVADFLAALLGVPARTRSSLRRACGVSRPAGKGGLQGAVVGGQAQQGGVRGGKGGVDERVLPLALLLLLLFLVLTVLQSGVFPPRPAESAAQRRSVAGVEELRAAAVAASRRGRGTGEAEDASALLLAQSSGRREAAGKGQQDRRLEQQLREEAERRGEEGECVRVAATALGKRTRAEAGQAQEGEGEGPRRGLQQLRG